MNLNLLLNFQKKSVITFDLITAYKFDTNSNLLKKDKFDNKINLISLLNFQKNQKQYLKAL